MRERVWAPALAVLLLAAAAMYSVVIYKPKPKWLLSSAVIPTLTIAGTPDNIKVEGMWVFNVQVNSYDRIDLLMAPPSLPLDSSLIQSKQIGIPLPSGAELRTRKAVRLLLEPNWPEPIYLGTMLERRYVFDDGTGTYRQWGFWEVDGWSERYVSYHLKISLMENGVETRVLKEQDVLVGPSTYGVSGVSLPEYGIQILNLGQITQGKNWPSSDLALIYVDSREAKWVSKTDLKNYLRYSRLGATYPGSPCMVKIKLVGATAYPEGQKPEDLTKCILDGGRRFYHKWETPLIHYPWIKTELKITSGFDDFSNSPEMYIDEDQALAFGYTDYEWKIKVEPSLGFNPEEFRLSGASGVYKPLEWSGGTLDQIYTMTFNAKDPDRGRTLRLEFRGKADRWDEVSKQTGVVAISKAFDVPKFITAPPSEFGRLEVWQQESLYKEEVPRAPTEFAVVPGTIQTTRHMRVMCSAPADISALVRIEVPLSVFDSYVYIPPGGIPKITKVEPDPLELPGGETKELKIRVKNLDDFSGGTFVVKLDLPKDVYCLGATSPVIGPGQEGYITVKLNAGYIPEDRKERVDFTVTAVGSTRIPNTDSGSFTLELKKGYGITPPEYSSLTVVVLDKKTSEPIEGATVTCAGVQMETDSRGVCVFDRVRGGSQTVTVSKEGYVSVSKSVTVLANQNNFATIYLSTSRELSETLKGLLGSLLLVIPLVVAAAGALYYLYRKKRVRR